MKSRNCYVKGGQREGGREAVCDAHLHYLLSLPSLTHSLFTRTMLTITTIHALNSFLTPTKTKQKTSEKRVTFLQKKKKKKKSLICSLGFRLTMQRHFTSALSCGWMYLMTTTL